MIENAVPVFFRPEGSRIPAEIVHPHGSVSNSLVRPQPDLPLLRLRRERPLPRFARLLFHDHKRLAAFDASREIMSHRRGGADGAYWYRARFHALIHVHFKKPGIVVESDKIEIL